MLFINILKPVVYKHAVRTHIFLKVLVNPAGSDFQTTDSALIYAPKLINVTFNIKIPIPYNLELYSAKSMMNMDSKIQNSTVTLLRPTSRFAFA